MLAPERFCLFPVRARCCADCELVRQCACVRFGWAAGEIAENLSDSRLAMAAAARGAKREMVFISRWRNSWILPACSDPGVLHLRLGNPRDKNFTS